MASGDIRIDRINIGMNFLTAPQMEPMEWSFYKSHLKSDQLVLEYGSGASTIESAPLVKKIWSIEHDEQWYPEINQRIQKFNNVDHIFIKRNNPKGKKPSNYEDFKDYIEWPKTQSINWDVVLIDGRGRQWVAESILDNINKDTLVFVHDWARSGQLKPSHRPRYDRILDFYNPVMAIQSLVLLRKK